MDALIDAGRLNDMFTDCLFRDEEVVDGQPPEHAVIVEGIMATFGLHPGRLKSYQDEVVSMINGLPDPFHKDRGGGWSFLQMCNDKNDTQWTGMHRAMEQLVVLGIGLEIGSYCLPRELWETMPGGMPYVVFDVPKEK